MTSSGVPRGGWARTPLPITDDMLVVDIGSGAFPNPRADLLCDRDLVDNRHRAGLDVVVDRPMMRADVTALPVPDGGIDFVIVSHLAEHIEDPDAFCRELSRAAVAGYIETPSPITDYVLDEEYHLWRVGRRDGAIEFRRKRPKHPLVQKACDQFYMVFYSAQPSCHRRTRTLPKGPVGRVLGFVIRGIGAVLNRSGVMHTRILFDPMRPLRWRIEQEDGTFVEGPSDR